MPKPVLANQIRASVLSTSYSTQEAVREEEFPIKQDKQPLRILALCWAAQQRGGSEALSTFRVLERDRDICMEYDRST